MTAIEQAIRDAIEKGGWDDTNYAFGTKQPSDDDVWVDPWFYDSKVFLDPAFWQALGKARGWRESSIRHDYYGNHGKGELELRNIICADWLYNWHRFIDHLAEGKNAELFFQSL